MNKGKTIFGITLGIVALGGAYWLYSMYRKRKEKEADMANIPQEAAVIVTSTTTGGSTTITNTGQRNDNFPLAKGSRGTLVKGLQSALMILYPNSLPKFGADGIWGNETENALKSNNQPTVINKPDYDRLVAASKSGALPNIGNTKGVAGWF